MATRQVTRQMPLDLYAVGCPPTPSCPEASTLTSRDVSAPQAYFAGYGAVKDAVIMHDRVTNRSRGFGFVIFIDPASVTAVLDDGISHEIDGRKVEVKPALPKELVEKDEGAVNTTHGSASSFMQPIYFGVEDSMQYMDQMQYMMPPFMPPVPHYYAYGVAPPATSLPEMHSKPRGVPMPPGGEAAHSFIILPNHHSTMSYPMSPPRMPMCARLFNQRPSQKCVGDLTSLSPRHAPQVCSDDAGWGASSCSTASVHHARPIAVWSLRHDVLLGPERDSPSDRIASVSRRGFCGCSVCGCPVRGCPVRGCSVCGCPVCGCPVRGCPVRGCSVCGCPVCGLRLHARDRGGWTFHIDPWTPGRYIRQVLVRTVIQVAVGRYAVPVGRGSPYACNCVKGSACLRGIRRCTSTIL